MKRLLIIVGAILAVTGCAVQATMSVDLVDYYETSLASVTKVTAVVRAENTGNVDILSARINVFYDLQGGDSTTWQADVSLQEGESKEFPITGQVNYSGAVIENVQLSHTIEEHDTRGLF